MDHQGRKEIDEALGRFLDGEPEPTDSEILAGAIASDPEFARELRRLLELDDLLRQDAEPDDRAFMESVRMRIVGRPDAGDFLRRFHRLPVAPTAPSRAWGHRMAAAASMVAAVLAIAWATQDRWAPRPTPPAIEHVRSKVESPEPSAAVLTRLVDARWEPPSVPIDEGAALAPGHLRLRSGLVQLEFLSGAAVILEGPCDFELLSPDRAVCHRGKVRAHVPPAASGFTIATPDVEAIDLGTEFVVNVDERGEGKVQVVEGVVRVHGSRPGSPLREARTLEAGQGIAYGPGSRLRDLMGQPTGFVDRSRLLRMESEHRRRRYQAWLDHSRALRNDPGLVLYFPFEEPHTWERTVRNLAGVGSVDVHDGAVVGCLGCPGRWPDKSALEFKRTEDRVRINVPGAFDQLALVAWVRVEGLNRWLSALMLTDDWDLGEAHWQITSAGELILGVALPNSRDGDGLRSPPILGPKDLGRWVHLVSTYDRRTNRIVHYCDGRRVAEGPLRVPMALRIGPATLGNWQASPGDIEKPYRSLNGRIDEFAVFRRRLTDDEVNRMYELGKPSS